MSAMALPRSRFSSRAVTAMSCRRSSRRSSSWPRVLADVDDVATGAPRRRSARGAADRAASAIRPIVRGIDLDADGDHAIALAAASTRARRASRCSRPSAMSSAVKPSRCASTGRTDSRSVGAGVGQAVERVDHARHLFAACASMRGPLRLQEGRIGRVELDLDGLGRPHQVADQVGQDARELPLHAGQRRRELGAQRRRSPPRSTAAGRGRSLTRKSPVFGSAIASARRAPVRRE